MTGVADTQGAKFLIIGETMGLFGFGKKKDLLFWQKAVIENSPDRVVQTEDQLRKLTNVLVANDVRIIQESIDIIQSTKSAETKESRCKVLADRIQHLEKLEPFADVSNKKLIQHAKQILKG